MPAIFCIEKKLMRA